MTLSHIFQIYPRTIRKKLGQNIEVIHLISWILETKTVFAAVFDRFLSQAYQKGYPKAEHIYIDSTYIKTNANKLKSQDMVVVQERKAYQAALDKECDRYSEENG